MRPAFASLALGLAACEPFQTTWDTGSAEGASDQQALVVTPAAIDFGTRSAQAPGAATASFTVANAGTTPISVHGHDEVALFEGEGAAFTIDAEPYFELLPGEERAVDVRFTPPTEGSWSGEVRVNYGVETLALSGSGAAPVAMLDVVAPEPVAFGCESVGELRIGNPGSEPLTVLGIDALEPAVWQVASDETTVPPGGLARAPITFAPPWTGDPGGPRNTVLTIETNDPQQPRLQVPVQSLVYEGEQVVDRFAYAPDTTADLLFVADTDGVMGLYVERSFDALEPLFGALDEGNVAHHAAALTTGDTCPASSPAWVSSETSRYTRARALQAALGGPADPTAAALLVHAATALDQQSAGCLAGLLQEGAQLHIVVISGRADDSGESVHQLISRITDAAPSAGRVVVSAIIATDSAGCGGATYGAGHAEAALETGGVILDLCQSDWTGGFERLAQVSTLAGQGALTRALEQQPLPESITVRVDGATFEGWRWDPTDNAVVFDETTAPDAGSNVELRYMTAVACEP